MKTLALLLALIPFLNGCGSGMAQSCTQNPDGSCMGQWYAVSYDAANFSSLGGTWNVPQSGVQTYKYSIAGKTMIVAFYLTGTTIGSGTREDLFLKIPDGKIATQVMVNAISINNGGAKMPGFSYTVGGSDKITITRIDEANYDQSGYTFIYGQITFEIN